MERADVVIIGGGIVGSATAYYLSRKEGKDPHRIVIIEEDPTYFRASTARSAGGVRQQFSTPENILMSQVTLALIRDLKKVFGPDADVGFREQGYLLLASPEGTETLAANVSLQRSMGADIELLDRAALGRFPWLTLDGVIAGSFGRSGEGWIDPVSLMTLFRKAAIAAGVSFVKDRVVRIELENRVEAVRLASGARIGCEAIVNAAGPAAGAVARLAGIELPVEPRKRYVYVVDSRRAAGLRSGPLTVDPSGVWFRPDGQVFLCGVSPDEASEPAAEDLEHIDYAPFEEIVWPTLAARVPAFEELKVQSAWAGFYDYNTLDQNAIIGEHPTVRGFYFANGFSGHGLQQAAAAGRAIAELIVSGRFQTIDLTRFGYARIARGEPLHELNVI